MQNISTINIAFQNKIKYVDDRKLAECNYKIISKILINNTYSSKWISETNASVLFVTKMKILFIYYTIVLSMITFGKLLAIVYNLTLHTNMLS